MVVNSTNVNHPRRSGAAVPKLTQIGLIDEWISLRDRQVHTAVASLRQKATREKLRQLEIKLSAIQRLPATKHPSLGLLSNLRTNSGTAFQRMC
jgi:hypothetical protein